MWHRSLSSQLRDLFCDGPAIAPVIYDKAITAVITLDRPDGPTTKSVGLTIPERMAFQATINNISHGVSLIRMNENLVVELVQDGWLYTVKTHPLTIIKERE